MMPDQYISIELFDLHRPDERTWWLSICKIELRVGTKIRRWTLFCVERSSGRFFLELCHLADNNQMTARFHGDKTDETKTKVKLEEI